MDSTVGYITIENHPLGNTFGTCFQASNKQVLDASSPWFENNGIFAVVGLLDNVQTMLVETFVLGAAPFTTASVWMQVVPWKWGFKVNQEQR